MSVLKQFEHLKIQLEAIEAATSNFATDSCIGEGGFGKVYKGELLHKERHTTVAVKCLDRRFGQGDSEFWKEIIMLSVYRHENVVSLLGFCDEKDKKILVYEYASKRSLDLHLDNKDLTWVRRLRVCIGAARGLAFLHNPAGTQQRVLHRDIKSSNILLDDKWNARIADLGLSKFGPANQKYTFIVTNNPVGTYGYCDPLYFESGILTKESDVYSFGVVLFEVLCGRLCFRNTENNRPQSFIQLVRKHYKQKNVNEIIWGDIKDEIHPSSLEVFSAIAYRCLKNDSEKRPLMDEIVAGLEMALEYQVKWLETHGVVLENLVENPPKDPRRDILKRHVCVGLAKRVPWFKNMDERLVDDICKRLKPRVYTDNSYIIREGGTIDEMLFIMRGQVETTPAYEMTSSFLNEGDFFGEDLLNWVLEPESNIDNLPSSVITLKALREVEAFALPADELKVVVDYFKEIQSSKQEGTLPYHGISGITQGAQMFVESVRSSIREKMRVDRIQQTTPNSLQPHDITKMEQGIKD